MKHLFKSIVALLICFSVLHAYQKQKFPSEKDTLYSSDRKYAIINVDAANNEKQHKIILKEISSGKEWKIIEYSRHVEVVWSPNSKAIAITDFSGSNHSNTYIFIVGDNLTKINLEEELSKLNHLKKHLVRNDHVYIKARKWVRDEMEISVEVYGDNDPNGFSTIVKYNLESGIKRSTWK